MGISRVATPFREQFFAQAVREEGILLLEAVSTQGIEDGRYHLGGTFRVQDQGVLAAGNALGVLLGQGSLIRLGGTVREPKVFQAGRSVPPVAGIMPALGVFHRGFIANLIGGFRVPRFQPLGIQGKAVKDRVRIFAFLGNESLLGPGR